MTKLILAAILFVIGFYCMIKPDNFLLPYLRYGGIVNAKQHIRNKGKTKGLIVWMRLFGAVSIIVSVMLTLAYLQII